MPLTPKEEDETDIPQLHHLRHLIRTSYNLAAKRSSTGAARVVEMSIPSPGLCLIPKARLFPPHPSCFPSHTARVQNKYLFLILPQKVRNPDVIITLEFLTRWKWSRDNGWSFIHSQIFTVYQVPDPGPQPEGLPITLTCSYLLSMGCCKLPF